MIPGLIAVLGALAVATAFGLAWRARNGQVRALRPRAGDDRAEPAGSPAERVPELTGAQEPAAAAGLASAALAGLEPAWANGQPGSTPGLSGTELGVTGEDLGTELGTRATLLQFSTAFCAPCRSTRTILNEIAAATDGVTHVEVDAGSRLDLVRRLGVRRTPTTFVLGPSGDVTHRASGEPRKADVIAALGAVI